MGIIDRLKKGLEKTKKGFTEKLNAIFSRGIDKDTLDEIEETLLLGDLGPRVTGELIEALKKGIREEKDKPPVEIIKKEMLRILGSKEEIRFSPQPPTVIMVVGVNGVGKTTTIGKLSHRYKSMGKSVIISASDTFRAGALDQLAIWAERAGVTLIKHQMGSDPGAVTFDALNAGKARRVDIVIVDTAGRLHTKTPLMEELKKVKKVMQKVIPDAPHETLLVVDATTGQNALQQARFFNEAIGVTGIVLTKLDGTSKGGIVFAIKKELGIPVKLIGVGEGMDDLEDFVPEIFVEELFS